ncbi:hypothetical protein HWC35_gp106 [Vibrio phage USC-1]|uniref:Uncharacterized protein n=2 Tax=Aphroditevirus USC1 TaxID=2846605 RepID=A0A514A2I4_9CAUD|nr:hypothetical protein HWC35_gp106 [Vibrio phage USC-1]QCW23228.1 hypothetical protein [Vibrio phage 5 TSL-2019]QDH47500.1 hypothetical protein [Vibrio phage USC-1]
METNNPKILSVVFTHVFPNNEYISHETYQRVIECAVREIFQHGSYQPTILASVVESVMDELDGMHGMMSYSFAFDQVYADLYEFLEDVILGPANIDSLNTLTTLYGTGEIHSILCSPVMTNILLLVSLPHSLIKN